MTENNPNKDLPSSTTVRELLANERTHLAWIRTSIAIMAFGFVVVKFTLFVKQISLLVQKPLSVPGHGYASMIGIFLVALGAVIALLSFLQFKRVERQLLNVSYRPSTLLSTTLTVSIILVGILLVAYLIYSI